MIRTFFILILNIAITCRVFCQVPAQTLPEFQFFRQDQHVFTDKDLPKGKMLFFVFFDSDCEHCLRAIRNIDRQSGSFQKAAIYLISLDDPGKADRFMTSYGPRLNASKNVVLLQDKLNQFIIKFKPVKYPSMFLYSADRKLIDYEDNEETIFRFVHAITHKK